MPTRLMTGMITCFGSIFFFFCDFLIQGIGFKPDSNGAFDRNPAGAWEYEFEGWDMSAESSRQAVRTR